jgi:mitogen-activated protein kinase kinase kinase
MFADFEDDDDDVVGTFVTPMQPYMESLGGGGGNKSENGTKPKLSLNTDTSPSAASTTKPDFQIPQIQQPQDSTGEISATTRSSVPSSDTTLVMGNAATTTTGGASGGATNGNLSVAERDSRRVSFTGDDWAVRPPIDAVYENLEDFFPHHDLDKPIDIGVDPPELSSPSSPGGPGGAGIAGGGSMATLAVPGSGGGASSSSSSSSSSASPSAAAAAAAAAIGTSASTMARLKGRTRSIRVVAQEKKKLLRRTEDRARAQKLQLATNAGGGGALGLRDPAAAAAALDGRGAALLRRKSTKLWGAKIMEVVPGDQVSIPPINEASAGDDDTNNCALLLFFPPSLLACPHLLCSRSSASCPRSFL